MRLSFEFFPPRTPQGRAGLLGVAERLNRFRPAFFSVTYGANGSTREGTADTVQRLLDHGMATAPHLSMGGDDEEQIQALVDEYLGAGVRRIVALRGDSSSDVGSARFLNNAEALVRVIRSHCGDALQLEVAGYPDVHPEAASPASDLEFLKRKVDAGANGIITQYFYHPYAFFDFRRRAEAAGIGVPIVPGIMPLTNFARFVRFSKDCGADVPRWLYKRLEAYREDERALQEFGIDVVTRLCQDLIDAGVPGLHFYTLNRWGATTRICENLRLPADPAADHS
ncbi:MAG: methylenetetrahydrofolate reductase [NAD(P)H] [Gammaproteobacteria bacterium]|nr:methylenetetrahydrofolate reductase [NAD(P)H] [Gammaproteobacteria bacterium]